MKDSWKSDVVQLYETLIDGWNRRDAQGMGTCFTDAGIQIGFDGSKITGRESIVSHLAPIFDSHPTPPFVTKVKDVRVLGDNAVLLQAIAGMVPPGETNLSPELHAHQTLVAVNRQGVWKVELFQNTPAQFHGRPDLKEAMTEELESVQDNGSDQ